MISSSYFGKIEELKDSKCDPMVVNSDKLDRFLYPFLICEYYSNKLGLLAPSAPCLKMEMDLLW